MHLKILLIQGGFWELLSHASLFAWIILVILMIMSLGSWGIILNKWKSFRGVETDTKRFLAAFHRRGSLKDMSAKCRSYRRSPLSRVFEEGFREYQTIVELNSRSSVETSNRIKLDPDQLDTIDRILEKESNIQIGKLEHNVSFLATTGNVAPFFGLLGTCWGIMYAFLNIGVQGSASLIVVAPGIAEALIATILGLAVAIPAVIGFNWCNTKLKNTNDDLNTFSLEFLAVVAKEQNL